MPFLGELAAVGTSLCFSFGSVFFTNAGRLVGSIVVNQTRLLLALLVVMGWHWLTYGQLLPLDAGADRWVWLGVSGVIGFVVGDAFLFQAFVMVGPRLAMLMMALAPVLGAVLAWLFLNEMLTGREILGIAVTLAGIIMVISERRGNGAETVPGAGRRYVLGLLCGLGGAAGQAIGLILSKKGLADDFPALSGNLIRLLAATVAIWILAVVGRRAISGIRAVRQQPRSLLLMTGGPVLGVWLSLVAVQNTSVGVASTLSSLMPIFLIPISYVMLKERASRQAVLGTLVAIAGMVILFV